MQCGSLDWILEQKMSINGKTGEIRIKSVVNNTVTLLISQFWKTYHGYINIRGSWVKGIQ